MIETDLENYQR